MENFIFSQAYEFGPIAKQELFINIKSKFLLFFLEFTPMNLCRKPWERRAIMVSLLTWGIKRII